MTASEQAAVYKTYRPKVFGYFRSRLGNIRDAEDLCEAVFEKAFAPSAGFDEKIASAGTWLYAVSRNALIDYYRKKRPVEDLPEDLADDVSPEDGVLKKETLEELGEALLSLPPDLRDLIVLHYYDLVPLKEIAETSGLSYGAVKLRHAGALKLLREKMTG